MFIYIYIYWNTVKGRQTASTHIIFILFKQNYWTSSQVRQHLLSYYIDKTNMENNCAFANLEDKYTFRLDKMAIASSRWMCRTLPIQGRIARVSFRLHRMYTQLPILSIYVLGLFSIVIIHYIISLRLGFRRHFLCIFILISFQALSRVFWKFKISPPVHSDGYFGMDGLYQIKCR